MCRARAVRRDEYLILRARISDAMSDHMRRIPAIQRREIFQMMSISGARIYGYVWRNNASGDLRPTRWRRRLNVFPNAAFYLGRAPPPSGLEMLAAQPATTGHLPHLSPVINPPRYPAGCVRAAIQPPNYSTQ